MSFDRLTQRLSIRTEKICTPFASTLDAKFLLISPSGAISACQKNLTSIKSADGGCGSASNPSRIWVEQPRVGLAMQANLLATYEEWQEIGGVVTVWVPRIMFRREVALLTGLRLLYPPGTWRPGHASPG